MQVQITSIDRNGETVVTHQDGEPLMFDECGGGLRFDNVIATALRCQMRVPHSERDIAHHSLQMFAESATRRNYFLMEDKEFEHRSMPLNRVSLINGGDRMLAASSLAVVGVLEDAKENPDYLIFTAFGMLLKVDETLPPNVIEFRQNSEVVGRIVNFTL